MAFAELLSVIDNFNNGLVEKNKLTINYKITDMIEQLKQTNLSSKVEKVFSKNVADMWDDKSRFVTYHGVKNPITSEVLNNSCDGMKIADIGCGTGKLLSKIDQKIRGANLIGLDISDDMVSHAQTRIYTSNNKMEFINRDFLQYNFGTQFDLIIFSYVLHHMDDPKEALQKARKMLSENGKILFSVPGDNYLTETFLKNELDGRFSLQQMDEIVSQAGLYPLSACRNDFLMTFNSYEMYLKYLKSIGTYQKVSGYSDKSWSDEFDKSIMERYNSSSYITGEYLTYNCVDKAKILRR